MSVSFVRWGWRLADRWGGLSKGAGGGAAAA